MLENYRFRYADAWEISKEMFEIHTMNMVDKCNFKQIFTTTNKLYINWDNEVIEKRRMRLIWHIVRMPQDRILRTTLKWAPAQGKRLRGKPCNTWCRTVEKDLKKRGLTWGILASNRRSWWNTVVAFVPPLETCASNR